MAWCYGCFTNYMYRNSLRYVPPSLTAQRHTRRSRARKLGRGRLLSTSYPGESRAITLDLLGLLSQWLPLLAACLVVSSPSRRMRS